MGVEPVPGEAAATVDADGDRLLVLGDYHAGIESALRREGVELDDRADHRRERVLGLLASIEPDRLVFLGDLGHSIGEPAGEEWAEIEALFEALDLPVTVVKGNHDGEIEDALASLSGDVEVTAAAGTRIGDVGLAHGHTWPGVDVVTADAVCVGHEHPVVRLEDEVGGARSERAWLRGRVAAAPFAAHHDREIDAAGDLVVFPAFNELSGGTWVNVADREFLAPFLPEGLADGEAYLLDGTRLGDYRGV